MEGSRPERRAETCESSAERGHYQPAQRPINQEKEKQPEQKREQREHGGGGDASCQKAMKILYTNIRGLQSKLNELKCQVIDLNPDVIILCEKYELKH